MRKRLGGGYLQAWHSSSEAETPPEHTSQAFGPATAGPWLSQSAIWLVALLCNQFKLNTMEEKLVTDAAPLRDTEKEIKQMRGDLIFRYYQWWKLENPEKRIFNKSLGDYIYVNHDSLTETIRYARDTYKSTLAVLHLDELLANAMLVKEVNADTASSSQNAYEKMLIMKHHLADAGDVRMLVGVKRSDRTTKVQYCITVIDLSTGNGYNENERHERSMHRKGGKGKKKTNRR